MRVTSTTTNTQSSDVQSTKGASKAVAADKAKKSSKGTSASAAESGDTKTDISPKAKEFAQAKKIASDAPDVREAKIAELRKRISEGHYKVDADAVADRMVDDHLQMSGLD